MSAYTLNTRSSLQTKLHLTATGQSFTKNFSLAGISRCEITNNNASNLLAYSVFRLVGWHFLPDEDGKIAETISIVPISLSSRR